MKSSSIKMKAQSKTSRINKENIHKLEGESIKSA